MAGLGATHGVEGKDGPVLAGGAKEKQEAVSGGGQAVLPLR